MLECRTKHYPSGRVRSSLFPNPDLKIQSPPSGGGRKRLELYAIAETFKSLFETT